ASYPQETDIIHTRLDLRFDWENAYVIGQARIQAKPYFYNSSTTTLDANGFKINSVQLMKGDERLALKYVYDGKKLHIELDKTYAKDESYELLIDYIAMPNNLVVGTDIASAGDRGFYFINRDGSDPDKPRQIWTQGETECNSSWFPTINGPQEKMSQELHL